MAAASRSKQKDAEESVATSDEVSSKSPFAGGGIAAAAAMAAASRSKQKEVEKLTIFDEGSSKEPHTERTCLTAAVLPNSLAPDAAGSEGTSGHNAARINSSIQDAALIVRCNDLLLAILSVALQNMSTDARDIPSLHCVRILCEYTNRFNSNDFAVKHGNGSLSNQALGYQQETILCKSDIETAPLAAMKSHHDDVSKPTCMDNLGRIDTSGKTGPPNTCLEASLCPKFMLKCRLDYRGVIMTDFSTSIDCKALSCLQEKSLLRSLSLSNQAMASGMAGWLEYGSSSVLDRSADHYFEITQNLASLHAQQDDWRTAMDVLRAMVIKCEHHLPLYHPLTLTSMLDLAGALIEVSEKEQARTIANRVLKRLSLFLSEQEENFLDARSAWANTPGGERVSFQEHDSSDFLTMIAEFAKHLLRLQGRDIFPFFHESNSALMLNHCMIADSLAVLANCIDFDEGEGVELLAGNNAGFFWSMACDHYRRALEGWSRAGQGLHQANISAVACSIARCLRETGNLRKAVKILTTVVSARNVEGSQVLNCSPLPNNAGREIVDSVSFLPPRGKITSFSAGSSSSSRNNQIQALCLWSLAVYQVEESPGERQRIHALNLLHSSADCLRLSSSTGSYTDDETKRLSLQMLKCIEDEARELFNPLAKVDDFNDLHGPKDHSDDDCKGVGDLEKRLTEATSRFQGRSVPA
jgi:hypothetical protein